MRGSGWDWDPAACCFTLKSPSGEYTPPTLTTHRISVCHAQSCNTRGQPHYLIPIDPSYSVFRAGPLEHTTFGLLALRKETPAEAWQL